MILSFIVLYKLTPAICWAPHGHLPLFDSILTEELYNDSTYKVIKIFTISRKLAIKTLFKSIFSSIMLYGTFSVLQIFEVELSLNTYIVF